MHCNEGEQRVDTRGERPSGRGKCANNLAGPLTAGPNEGVNLFYLSAQLGSCALGGRASMASQMDLRQKARAGRESVA